MCRSPSLSPGHGREDDFACSAHKKKKIDFFHLFPEQRPVLSLADYSIKSHKNIKLLYRNQIKIAFHDVNKGAQVDFVSLSPSFFKFNITQKRETKSVFKGLRNIVHLKCTASHSLKHSI